MFTFLHSHSGREDNGIIDILSIVGDSKEEDQNCNSQDLGEKRETIALKKRTTLMSSHNKENYIRIRRDLHDDTNSHQKCMPRALLQQIPLSSFFENL